MSYIEKILYFISRDPFHWDTTKQSIFHTLAQMCVDMKVHKNDSAAAAYYDICLYRDNYQFLIDASIHSMKNECWIGLMGYG